MKFGNKDAVVHSFPPGNIMVCNISEGGKVNLKETMRFHSFDDHPLHFKYQRVELNEGIVVSEYFLLLCNTYLL